MDETTKALFDEIIAMDQETLNDEQKGFLMARRGYFNDEQKKRYADMIKLHEAGKLFKKKEEDEDDLSTLSMASLKKVAKAEDVNINKLKSEKEIIKAIEAKRNA